MATTIRRGCQRRNRPSPAQAPRGKLSVRLGAGSSPGGTALAQASCHHIPEAREAPDGESDDHRRHAMVRKADLKFLDRIRREVQVDVAATNVVTWASNLERVRAGKPAFADGTSDDALQL